MMLTLTGRLVQFVIMFMSVRLMTHLLPPTQMGRVALVTTGIAFFALFLVNPVGMFFNRRLHAWFNAGRCRGYIHLYALYLVAVGQVAVIAWWMISRAGLDRVGLAWGWIVVLVGGSLFFNTAIQTLITSLNMLGRELSFTVLNLSTLVMSLLYSLLFCGWGGATAEHWIAGTVAGQAMLTVIAYSVLFRSYPLGGWLTLPAPAQRMQAFHFCWPVAVAVGLQWLHMQGYRFVLADRFGLAEFGLFAAGYGVAAALVSAGETILTTWFQPAFYRAINSSDEADRDAAWSVYAARMLPASLLGVSALVAASDVLPRLMLGAEYHDVGLYVMLGAFTEWGRMLVGVFGLNAHRHMSTRQLVLPNALGALATIAGILASVQVFGLGISSAPVCAALGCGVVVATLWWTSTRVETNSPLNLHRLVFQAASLLLAALVMARALAALPFQGPAAIALSCVAVGLTWAAFTFLMRGDLMQRPTPGQQI